MFSKLFLRSDLLSLRQLPEQVEAHVEEVERPPGSEEDRAHPDEKLVRLPPPL